jgi:hypothetical protein
MESIPREIPPMLRDVLSRDPSRIEASPMFASAVAYNRAGVPVLPVKQNGKEPHTVGPFRHGGKSATVEHKVVRDHWLEHPDDNVGWVSDGHIVFADIDPRHGGSLDALAGLRLPIDGYRERTAGGGWHLPLIMPSGVIAIRSVTIAPGVEIKARGSYIVSAHSQIDRRWYRPEPGRDIWQFGAIPERWEHLDRLIGNTLAPSTFTILPEDYDEASRVFDRLRKSSDYAKTISMILDGGWETRYPTRSETDAALVYMASHFVRTYERPREALFALLQRHSLKAASHANPDQYLLITVDNALQYRQSKDAQHVETLAHIINCSLSSKSTTTPITVTDPTLWVRRESRRILMRDVLAFAGAPVPDVYTERNAWRRLPVNHMSVLHETSGESVRRAQIDLKTAGLIKRAPRPKGHDGGPRMDARIRITERGREALDAIRLTEAEEARS